jgi:hypothetical protein
MWRGIETWTIPTTTDCEESMGGHLDETTPRRNLFWRSMFFLAAMTFHKTQSLRIRMSKISTIQSSDRKEEQNMLLTISRGLNVNISGHRLNIVIAQRQSFKQRCSGLKFLAVINMPCSCDKEIQKNRFFLRLRGGHWTQALIISILPRTSRKEMPLPLMNNGSED